MNDKIRICTDRGCEAGFCRTEDIWRLFEKVMMMMMVMIAVSYNVQLYSRKYDKKNET